MLVFATEASFRKQPSLGVGIGHPLSLIIGSFYGVISVATVLMVRANLITIASYPMIAFT
jgi:hypothetical protein